MEKEGGVTGEGESEKGRRRMEGGRYIISNGY